MVELLPKVGKSSKTGLIGSLLFTLKAESTPHHKRFVFSSRIKQQGRSGRESPQNDHRFCLLRSIVNSQVNC